MPPSSVVRARRRMRRAEAPDLKSVFSLTIILRFYILFLSLILDWVTGRYLNSKHCSLTFLAAA